MPIRHKEVAHDRSGGVDRRRRGILDRAGPVSGIEVVGRVAPHDLTAEAIEDHDLALSRLAWAQACTCRLVDDQIQALDWHSRQCEETLAAMEALHAGGYIPEQPRS